MDEAGALEAFKEELKSDGVIDDTAIGVAPPTPLPGPLAYNACGLAGLICVIIAGWTTANPTIYRAGLAFQAIMPTVSRFKVTLATGLIATVAGLFPAITMRLLGFVAIYGMILMPMGAVIFVDFWLFKKRRLFGSQDDYAERSGIDFNWAAGVAWIATLVICVALVILDPEINGVRPFQIYFVSLPGWFVAALLYIAVSVIVQRRLYLNSIFRLVCQLLSWISLAGIVVPGAVYLTGGVSLEDVQLVMIISTVVWFIATPLWMGMLDKKQQPEESAE
jgi:purine-cytosine permease-like protein